MVKKLLEKGYLAIILCVLYAPILFIIVYSFSGSSNFNFENGFTFESYKAIFTSDKAPALWEAVGNTFLIAIVSSIASGFK